MTLEEAYRRFGAKKWHNYSTWSSIADNGLVVITLWTHLMSFNKQEKKEYWSCFGTEGWWHKEIGNRKRIEHILYSLENHNGFFRAINVTPKNKDVNPLEIDKRGARPVEKKWWKVIEFEPMSGEFKAECDWSWSLQKGELFPNEEKD